MNDHRGIPDGVDIVRPKPMKGVQLDVIHRSLLESPPAAIVVNDGAVRSHRVNVRR